MNRKLAIVLLSLALSASPVWATTHNAAQAGGTQERNRSVAADSPMSEGEVRKIDKEAAKLTIRHGELKNLQMPAMTMVFRVKDPAMLDQVKVGDKIGFVAEKIGGQFTVTRIEPKG